MELPFAVGGTSDEQPHPQQPAAAVRLTTTTTTTGRTNKEQDNDDGSLVTASSDGGGDESSMLGGSSTVSFDPIPGNYNNTIIRHQHHQPISGYHTNQQQRLQPPPPPPTPGPSNNNRHQQHHRPHSSIEETNNGLAEVLSQFGVTQTPDELLVPATAQQQPVVPSAPTKDSRGSSSNNKIIETETIDFTYVNVCETDEDDVDILLSPELKILNNNKDNNNSSSSSRGDILSLLLSERVHGYGEEKGDDGNNASNNNIDEVAKLTEQANQAVARAEQAKKDGNLQQVLDNQTAAAKLFRDAASIVRDRDPSMANSLLLLSQTQAKSALALKRVVKLRPNNLLAIKQKLNSNTSQKEMLRAAVRGALDNRTEADISESTFLGKATKGPVAPAATTQQEATKKNQSLKAEQTTAVEPTKHNPVDEMMALERELRNMDMAIEMGNSIASLDARTQNRMKSSIAEGSFMVVPPGSGSYMSSSALWNSTANVQQSTNRTTSAAAAATCHPHPHHRPSPGMTGTAGVRARANRVQSIAPQHHQVVIAQPPQTIHTTKNDTTTANTSLESSWWGNSSVASQVMTSSVISIASGIGGGGGDVHGSAAPGGGGSMSQAAYTKQLMRLLDSLTTLKGENDALLREVESAKAAVTEARATKEQMRRFKEEYSQKYAALTRELEEFRKSYPGRNPDNKANPVTSSEFGRTASTSDQVLRQEQLIKKLTADLKKEKETSKKKDGALRKYESFYREVKARSAQKAAQRQKETQQQRHQQQQQQQQQSRHSAARSVSKH